MSPSEQAASRGEPSYVWRAGQERRFQMVRRHVPLEGRRVLDVGCGLGLYMAAFRRHTPYVYGVEIEFERAREARGRAAGVVVARAEALPFAAGSFDVVFSHEVVEHVEDDRQMVIEACRVLAPGGHLVLFAPNRFYFFETHGFYWRGRYHFGNIPLINYLPNPLRNRLAPHVRAYTVGGLRRLLRGLPLRLLHHTQIYPGYDRIVARRPRLGRLLRAVTYALERTPLRRLGLSHFLVARKEVQLRPGL